MSRSYSAGVQREGEFQNTARSGSATEERQQSAAAAMHLADCSDKPTGEKHSHSGGRRGETAEVEEEEGEEGQTRSRQVDKRQKKEKEVGFSPLTHYFSSVRFSTTFVAPENKPSEISDAS